MVVVGGGGGGGGGLENLLEVIGLNPPFDFIFHLYQIWCADVGYYRLAVFKISHSSGSLSLKKYQFPIPSETLKLFASKFGISI